MPEEPKTLEEIVILVISDLVGTPAITIFKLVEDLGMDSLDIVEMENALEDQLGYEVDVVEPRRAVTVKDVIEICEESKV